eukprot:g69282.t1
MQFTGFKDKICSTAGPQAQKWNLHLGDLQVQMSGSKRQPSRESAGASSRKRRKKEKKEQNEAKDVSAGNGDNTTANNANNATSRVDERDEEADQRFLIDPALRDDDGEFENHHLSDDCNRQTVRRFPIKDSGFPEGSGAYGAVYLAQDRLRLKPANAKYAGTFKQVALKKVGDIFGNPINTKRLLRELKILRLLRGHPHIINFEGVLMPKDFRKYDRVWLVFDSMPMDLRKFLQSDQKELTELHIKYLLGQMLNGVKYMHSCGIIHRDIKPANILIDAEARLKIIDFGLARSTLDSEDYVKKTEADEKARMEAEAKKKQANKPSNTRTEKQGPTSSPEHAQDPGEGVQEEDDEEDLDIPPPPARDMKRNFTQHVMTRYYRAPELNLRLPYSFPVDIWACGCVFAELLMMEMPIMQRKPFFQGSTAYPLSPAVDEDDCQVSLDDLNHPIHDPRDQLNVIFDVLGSPSQEEIARIPSTSVRDRLNSLKKKNNKQPRAIKDLFEGCRFATDDALDLLSQMLHFDPKKRITAKEALEHKYFQGEDTKFVSHPDPSKRNSAFKDKPPPHFVRERFEFEETDHFTPEQWREMLTAEIRASKLAEGES